MTDIQRSTQAGRAHGPTRARRAVGDLHGPPVAVPRQVRAITVRVEQLDDGRWRFTQPRVAGWAAAARTPGEVAAVLRQGFTEAQVAAYSDWRGHVYDAAVPTYRRSRPQARSKRRCDVYDPTEWRLTDNGMWISPKGHLYPEDRQAVQKVMAARQEMGLAARPDPIQPGATTGVVSMTVRAVESMDGRGRTA